MVNPLCAIPRCIRSHIGGILAAGCLLGGASPSIAVDMASEMEPFTPFRIIAQSWGIRADADAVAHEVAFAIAQFVARTDESALGLASSNWVLAGAPEGGEVSDESIAAAMLEIPTPYPVDPSLPVSPTNTRKINLIEVCNKALASKALGVAPVVGDTLIANGYLHATALPCEIAVYAENGRVYVEMLNAEAIFSLFFTDVLFGPQMADPVFAAELEALPRQVNTELPAIVRRALDDVSYPFLTRRDEVGPRFSSSWDIMQAVLQTPLNSPYVHFVYTKADASPFSDEDVSTIAATITETLTINGQPGAGIHDPALDEQLSLGSQWRAARAEPLSMPGNVKVIEACSPLYAKQAMGTGLHHATALPCEIALAKTPDASGLVVTFLDPRFMFKALFQDAFETMSDEELAQFAVLPDLVLGDLQVIVRYALSERLPLAGIYLGEGIPLYQDMFPF